ncbi:hypothetical protein DI43_12935 [Geobacillus sp. CAMR12739]|nr:hypothetical protein DI43_12935 [Geobacillus sp. CAMR12739]
MKHSTSQKDTYRHKLLMCFRQHFFKDAVHSLFQHSDSFPGNAAFDAYFFLQRWQCVQIPLEQFPKADDHIGRQHRRLFLRDGGFGRCGVDEALKQIAEKRRAAA